MPSDLTRREADALWRRALGTGDINQIAQAARIATEAKSEIDTSFRMTVCDKMWRPVAAVGDDLISATGIDPRNECPTGSLVIKGTSPLVDAMMDCRNTMVGVLVETAGLRWAFYVKNHRYRGGVNRAIEGHVELRGIWDILNYYVIWPSWWLPLQAQPFSHAIFAWGLQTVLENMVAECAMRIQSGWFEFINNALSFNLDVRTWFGATLQALQRDGLSPQTFSRMLRTPVYVKRTNPFLDGSPLCIRTVRMETVGSVIKDLTRPYGVDARMDLWLPGDPQPDGFTKLDQPTYVFSTYDRSQIEGPTHTVLDSVIKQVVNLGGSLGGIFNNVIKQAPGMNGVFHAPALGVNFEQPYAIMVCPDQVLQPDGTVVSDDSPVMEFEIADHSPEGWQHIIGGRSPKWLNDLMNAFFAWAIDSLMIVLGFVGVPSDLLAGFLNNSFLAFQMMQNYELRDEVGPYHPAVERFYPTASAPYNVESTFAFINALFDARGYTAAKLMFRNGDNYALGRDVFKGGLMSIVYRQRRYMVTDYVENVMWRVQGRHADVTVQVGDGRKDEPPLAAIQRLITGAFEALAVVTLSPQS